MKKYTTIILTSILIALTTFSGAAQDKESTLGKLKANRWHMQGVTDIAVSTKYGNKRIKQYYKEEKFKFTLSSEYYLSNTLDKEFNSSKVGKTFEGKYIIRRVARKKYDNRPKPVLVLEIIQLNENWLILRNVKHKHLLKYKAE